MNIKSIAIAAAMAISGASAFAAAPNLVNNGSFETNSYASNGSGFNTLASGNTSITGWTVGRGGIDLIGSYWNASNGLYSLDLSAGTAGRISQTLTTVANQRYTVSFDMAGNPAGGPGDKELFVSMGEDSFTFNTAGKTTTNMGWMRQSFDFIAIGTTTKLQFLSLTNTAYGPALDNVQVSAVPELETYAMLLAGLGLIGTIARRRKANQA